MGNKYFTPWENTACCKYINKTDERCTELAEENLSYCQEHKRLMIGVTGLYGFGGPQGTLRGPRGV
jgi:hypothetical protein